MLEYVVKIPLMNCFDRSSPFFNEERILYGIEVTKAQMNIYSLRIYFVWGGVLLKNDNFVCLFFVEYIDLF